MKLVIHDLNDKEWKKISHEYENWEIVSDNGTILPCYGCFRCWTKDPGQCLLNDDYCRMGYLVHHADEVKVISRYTYGGFSGSVKNIFDRCLGFVLPQLELVDDESHHFKRYPEDKPFSFVFYGNDLNDNEKNAAERYVNSVMKNFRGHVKSIVFENKELPVSNDNREYVNNEDRTVLVNGSMRGDKAYSLKFAGLLKKRLNKNAEIINIHKYINDLTDLYEEIKNASTIVICTPLYVDNLPSQVVRLLEIFERSYSGDPKNIYLIANMGLYESRQLVNLFEAVRQWSDKMDFRYGGGLGISAGELIGVLVDFLPFGKWPTKEICKGMNELAEAINGNKTTEDIYTEPKGFPRWLYMQIANRNWNNIARANGIDPKDMLRQL
ncbi:MAG: flavodoxin family protein [Erysipelotrichaceae bacterium]|nr:flavodoxin family protein [Erysipelotrichaceae bacterium]